VVVSVGALTWTWGRCFFFWDEESGISFVPARTAAPELEAGNWLPQTQWAEEMIEECAAFPNAAHDDCVDAWSQAASRREFRDNSGTVILGTSVRNHAIVVNGSRSSDVRSITIARSRNVVSL